MTKPELETMDVIPGLFLLIDQSLRCLMLLNNLCHLIL